RCAIHDIAAHPPNSGNILRRAVVIQRQHIKPALNQRRQTMTAEKAGGASYQYTTCFRAHASVSVRSAGETGPTLVLRGNHLDRRGPHDVERRIVMAYSSGALGRVRHRGLVDEVCIRSQRQVTMSATFRNVKHPARLVIEFNAEPLTKCWAAGAQVNG